jgi:hypothetical protein
VEGNVFVNEPLLKNLVILMLAACGILSTASSKARLTFLTHPSCKTMASNGKLMPVSAPESGGWLWYVHEKCENGFGLRQQEEAGQILRSMIEKT